MTSRLFLQGATATLLATACAVAFTAAAAPPRPVPPKVAQMRTTDLRLDGRDAAAGARDARTLEIRTPDAAFIKVHFANFSLPAGVTLEVSSPDGHEVYRYSKDKLGPHTVDASLGENGRTSFAAMSIQGPVALLRLVGTAREPWRAGQGVRVTRYLEGFPEAMLPELQRQQRLESAGSPEAICGTDDKEPAVCYADSDPTAFDRSRPVGRILMGNGSLCTAWRVGPDNRVFTNNHCTSTQNGVAASEVWFNYQRANCGSPGNAPVTKVAGDTMLVTEPILDYTLFTVKDFATISSFGYLGLDVNPPTLGEEIFIAGHPGGRPKELSVVSDVDGGGNCLISDPDYDGNGNNTDAAYSCDTEGGSSGSPVIARDTNHAIALHHFGNCPTNSGAKFSLIWPQVSTYFGGVVPPGDNDGGNTPPVAGFTSAATRLVVRFTDASSDGDGSIAARSWDFGDGGSSSATNPIHRYAAPGRYTVTLTVTDDDGATGTTSQNIVVRRRSAN